MNKNDKIINKKEISEQMDLDDFKYKDKFSFLCNLVPEKEKERLVIENENPTLVEKKGILYILVLKNKLIKVGSSTVSFKERVGSYNCGKKKYREKGTCSTTNKFVLQNLLYWDEKVKVYAFFPEEIEFDVLGEKETISLPAKRWEKKMLTELKKRGKLPILCTQK